MTSELTPLGPPLGLPLASQEGWFVALLGDGCLGSNHCVMTPGHVGDDFISLAANLRIPVYMHNLEEENIFRPSTWTAFGTSDLEAADFRACEKLGPLYTAYK